MMAIVIVFTIAAVIGLATAFPPGPDELSPWSVQPMPML
jgi:hypothetical protein